MTNPLDAFMTAGPVIPVVTIDDAAHALPLADALLAGGVRSIEITLRTSTGLKALEAVAKERPDIIASAGTVLSPDQFKQAENAGAQFVITPGLTTTLCEALPTFSIPLLPGVASPRDVMDGLDAGLERFKLFPAAVVGGIGMLKALAGPFPQVKFCPTGGVSEANCQDYLQLDNVLCVGGSWIAPRALIQDENWDEITKRAQQCSALAKR